MKDKDMAFVYLFNHLLPIALLYEWFLVIEVR